MKYTYLKEAQYFENYLKVLTFYFAKYCTLLFSVGKLNNQKVLNTKGKKIHGSA